MKDAGYPLAKELVAFIAEREKIRIKKERGDPRPWTKDEVLGTYRFCNIHREDDKVSRYVAELRKKYADDDNLWFLMVVARLFNQPTTLEAIREDILPVFKPEKVRNMLAMRKASGKLIFNAAYIVSTNGVAMDKVDYLLDRVLAPLWTARKRLRPSVNDTLEGWHLLLMTFDGLGSFIAAQVVADMKYAKPLDKAPDWQSFAASGPGSRRGLNRVMGVDPEAGWRRGAWEEALRGLAKVVEAPLRKAGIELHNQDLQNCLCEFDKMQRVLRGEGRPKQLYKEEK